MRGFHLLLGMMAWGAASITCAVTPTPAQQAFADAQALAAGAQGGAAASVGSGTVASTVNQFNPTYYNSNGTAPESALFQNGNGNTVSAGQAKTADCQNGTPNPDPFLRQNCEAINLMVRNPSVRPTIAIPPSMLAPSKAIVANANALAASSLSIADPNAVGAFTGCVNKTVGPSPTTKICSEFKGSAAQQCTVGRVVMVDEFTNYQCDKTVNTYLPQTCNRTVNVTITQPTPFAATPVYMTTNGTWTSSSTWIGSLDNGRSVPSASCNNNSSILLLGWFNSFSLSAAVDGQLITSANQAYLCPNAANCSWFAPATNTAVCPNLVSISHYTCPANTTLTGAGTSSMCVQPPVVTSTVNNGCTVQEAAAL